MFELDPLFPTTATSQQADHDEDLDMELHRLMAERDLCSDMEDDALFKGPGAPWKHTPIRGLR